MRSENFLKYQTAFSRARNKTHVSVKLLSGNFRPIIIFQKAYYQISEWNTFYIFQWLSTNCDTVRCNYNEMPLCTNKFCKFAFSTYSTKTKHKHSARGIEGYFGQNSYTFPFAISSLFSWITLHSISVQYIDLTLFVCFGNYYCRRFTYTSTNACMINVQKIVFMFQV